MGLNGGRSKSASIEAGERDRRVRKVLLLEGAANLTVLLMKAAVGLATGSVAILGDAVHSLTDLTNNALALLAQRLSARPPDADHPYGHRKFEPLAVFGLAVLLAVFALQLVIHAVGRGGSAEIVDSRWGLVLMAVVLATNVAISTWESRQAELLDSDLLRADARHTFSDVAVTLAVIAGWQLGARGWAWADSALATVVAVFVFYLAYDLFRRAVPQLVDEAAADPLELADAVGDITAVHEVRRVRTRRGGSGIAADIVISVAPELSTAEAHAVADEVEALLGARLGIADVTVHVEPARPRSGGAGRRSYLSPPGGRRRDTEDNTAWP